ncbi:hypothetical protein P872_19605 [Rhodonellum psychrophilum GCM71 = DSM 17998]|uniref:Rrf2 family transcriptional regulator n=2 Tax=Rhodonellum TaxID=336827 RepID=U5BMH2_9BACT|nr:MULTISPECIES: Rrf2 family transcriptional regulator [Rhodonellum]ERM81705.1 hypothetical protein P872_19605 [Rhodonellum psychrophilum GCM71 = DSM 17998]MDO9554778.1 Rrf2 family transcriptional regulator [Rhodonellum sp.]SDY83638.1 transcriptional regulator, BadM/Rrf2 family [Rhodonellum ikkaensis]
MFSKTCQYGIKSTLYIALQSINENRVSLKDIAKEIDSPEAFTAKILQKLVHAGIIISVRGQMGGFLIEREKMDSLKLIQIVNAIDGDHIFVECGLGLSQCNSSFPCPLHEQFSKIRTDLKAMMETTSLLGFATGLHDGLTFLKR